MGFSCGTCFLTQTKIGLSKQLLTQPKESKNNTKQKSFALFLFVFRITTTKDDH